MPVTLTEAKKNVQDDLQMGIIDEFQKSSWLLQNLTFDDVVSPTGGGATMTYAYTRLATQPTAAFRAVNSEYTPQEVTRTRVTADLKVFGGSYEIDRIIAGMGGIVSEVALQSQQKVKAAQALFNDTTINGDTGVDANAFDGLNKALTGTSTEYVPAADIDLSTYATVKANYGAFMMEVDAFLSRLNGKADALLMNGVMKSRFIAAAREFGLYTNSAGAFGETVETYNGIALIDMGTKAGLTTDVVGTTAGLTSIYAVRLGMDAFHGISMAGQPPVRTWLPDFTRAGAVKKGEVEMVAAIALKATKAAGVMRKLKIS